LCYFRFWPKAAAQRNASPFNLYVNDFTVFLDQWDEIHTNGDYYKGGWAGQGFLVNPQRELVAVFVSYNKIDESEVLVEPMLLEMLESIYGGE